jgi:methylenetetrahydrofolate reductase (NADPH)
LELFPIYHSTAAWQQTSGWPLKTFREAVQSDEFTITAELTLKRESDASEVARQAQVLGEFVDGIQVTDNPYAWVQMSSVSAAALLMQQGVDPIPIMTCRDRNRIALTSDLLGLQALGVTSVLLIRGHKVPENHSVPANPVYDATGRELIAMASRLEEEGPLGPGKELFIGTGARVFRAGPRWRGESLEARANAGARFLQTQLCFNLDILRQYMARLVEIKLTWKFSVVVSLSPLPSAKTARWLKENMSDSRIPDDLIERLEQASDPEQEGVKICAETMQQIAEIPGISGVNLMTVGNSETIPAAIHASGLRS